MAPRAGSADSALATDESMLNELIELMGPEAFATAFASFAEDLGQSAAALRAAAAALDAPAVRRHAHRAKGILAQFGASGAAARAFAVETAPETHLFPAAEELAALIPHAVRRIGEQARMADGAP